MSEPRQVPKHASGSGHDNGVESLARAACEARYGAGSYDNLPEYMRNIWRAHVTTGVPSR